MAHFIDVGCRTDVGFGGNDTAIGKLTHASGIGDFHPLDGVNVYAEVPLVHLVRMNAREQSEITCNH